MDHPFRLDDETQAPRLPRRALLRSGLAAAGAGAAATLALGSPAAAQKDGGGGSRAAAGDGSVRTTGFFEVPLTSEPGIIAILIGLLLPAVQKVRAPARLVLADSAGRAYVLPLPPRNPDRGDAPVSAFFTIRNAPAAAEIDGGRRVLVVDGPGVKGFEIPSPDGVLMALLLPAVQADGREAGLLAGTVQVLGDGSVRPGDGSVRSLLPFVEQQTLLGDGSVRPGDGSVRPGDGSVRPEHAFLGPFLADRGGTTRIGLLLPAVQKVTRPFVLVLLDSAGKTLARERIAPGTTGSPVPAFYEVTNQDGLKVVRAGDGSVLPIAAPTHPDGVLIALLLPAVQRVREAAARAAVGALGGSLMMPGGTTVALTAADAAGGNDATAA